MRSLLFQPGATPFRDPAGCGAIPCRTETTLSFYKDGREYRMVLRDKVVAEDPYLVMVKALAFAIRQQEPYAGTPPSRTIRDFLVKNNVII